MKCKHPTVSLDEATPNTFLGSQEVDHAERVQHRTTSSEPGSKKHRTSASTTAAAAKLQHLHASASTSTSSTLSEENVDDPSSLPVPSLSRPDTSVPASKSCNVVQQRLSGFVPKKMTSSQKGKVDEALLKLFTRDFQPFSIVE
ncbi:hypothetical protein J6590_001540 [Homalodisca vitripennis]|nr:hypothetical protein J6590_001540 [Homalodisca vitripennis]